MLKITLEYCTVWSYRERAASLAADLLEAFEPEIESLTLLPSNGGRFELTVNGHLLYSKLATYRHADPGECVQLVKKFLKEGKG